MFDRGIKNKLLQELGENMTPEESALAVLVEDADWETVRKRMAEYNFHGEIVVRELIAEHLAAVEKLVDQPPAEAVPEEVSVKASGAGAAPAEAPVAEAPAIEAAPAEMPVTGAAADQLEESR
jgi:hypothetical protein